MLPAKTERGTTVVRSVPGKAKGVTLIPVYIRQKKPTLLKIINIKGACPLWVQYPLGSKPICALQLSSQLLVVSRVFLKGFGYIIDDVSTQMLKPEQTDEVGQI